MNDLLFVILCDNGSDSWIYGIADSEKEFLKMVKEIRENPEEYGDADEDFCYKIIKKNEKSMKYLWDNVIDLPELSDEN